MQFRYQSPSWAFLQSKWKINIRFCLCTICCLRLAGEGRYTECVRYQQWAWSASHSKEPLKISHVCFCFFFVRRQQATSSRAKRKKSANSRVRDSSLKHQRAEEEAFYVHIKTKKRKTRARFLRSKPFRAKRGGARLPDCTFINAGCFKYQKARDCIQKKCPYITALSKHSHLQSINT